MKAILNVLALALMEFQMILTLPSSGPETIRSTSSKVLNTGDSTLTPVHQ